MDFEISDELRMMVDVVREFRERELMPLEHHFLVQGRFTAEERDAIDEKAKAAELWALDVPEDLGGQGIGELAMCLILEELFKHPAMYSFGGSPEPVLYHCNDEQKQRYLLPVISGERKLLLRVHGAGRRLRHRVDAHDRPCATATTGS